MPTKVTISKEIREGEVVVVEVVSNASAEAAAKDAVAAMEIAVERK